MRKHFLKIALLLVMPVAAFAQSQEINEGDAVTTPGHYKGTLKKVFLDGMVNVDIDGASYTFNLSQLSKPISCLGEICVNDAVTTSGHHDAIVKDVFPDGTTIVDISGSTYTYTIDQLAKPITCLPKICVNKAVNTSGHNSGVVKQIFADGLVKIEIKGNIYYTKIDQLSPRKK